MTKSVSSWVMTVPVISTAHMPGPDAIALLYSPSAMLDTGGVVYVDDQEPSDPPWLCEIAKKVEAPSGWVRIDADGPIIEGLATYDW